MLEETVRVVAQDGQYAWVEATSRSGCSSCGSSGSCGTSVLGGLFKKHKNYLRVVDDLGLKVGEMAIVGMEDMELTRAAFLAYLVPLLLMVFTSAIASSNGFDDTEVMLLSIVSLLGGFLLVQFLGKLMPGGLVRVRLLRRALGAGEHSIQFTNLERNSP